MQSSSTLASAERKVFVRLLGHGALHVFKISDACTAVHFNIPLVDWDESERRVRERGVFMICVAIVTRTESLFRILAARKLEQEQKLPCFIDVLARRSNLRGARLLRALRTGTLARYSLINT